MQSRDQETLLIFAAGQLPSTDVDIDIEEKVVISFHKNSVSLILK